MKGKGSKRRYIAQLHGLKRCEIRRLKLYRTVARDLARRAERGSLTLCDMDLRAAVRSQCPGLLGIGRRTLSTMMMQILHHEQMKLDDHRRPDHQPAVQSTSA